MSYPDGGNTMRFDPGWFSNTSIVIGDPNSLVMPREHIMRCRHCGTNSTISDRTDKIVALVCPQCGGALDE